MATMMTRTTASRHDTQIKRHQPWSELTRDLLEQIISSPPTDVVVLRVCACCRNWHDLALLTTKKLHFTSSHLLVVASRRGTWRALRELRISCLPTSEGDELTMNLGEGFPATRSSTFGAAEDLDVQSPLPIAVLRRVLERLPRLTALSVEADFKPEWSKTWSEALTTTIASCCPRLCDLRINTDPDAVLGQEPDPDHQERFAAGLAPLADLHSLNLTCVHPCLLPEALGG